MRPSRNIALTLLIIGASTLGSTDAGERSVFQKMMTPYETIRLALVHDHLDDVAESARKIHALAAGLRDGVDPQEEGIDPSKVAPLGEIVPSILESSDAVAQARSIAEARESFGSLSKALVAYRRLVDDPPRAVAFCSMAQKVWIQPEGEIGNPYYGQSMARCGEFVSR